MKVNVVNMEGTKVRTVDLPAHIFAAPIKQDLMHQAFVRQRANARQGTHSTKNRSEVSGGGRKPWRQKGTGRARHGSIRSPIWVGGGKIHTPRPRDYSKKMPKKMRRAALRSALSVKAAEENIVVVDEITIPEAKTKLIAESLSKLVGDASSLILMAREDAAYNDIVRSTANLPKAKTLVANYINIRDLLGYDKVILPLNALDVITSFLG